MFGVGGMESEEGTSVKKVLRKVRMSRWTVIPTAGVGAHALPPQSYNIPPSIQQPASIEGDICLSGFLVICDAVCCVSVCFSSLKALSAAVKGLMFVVFRLTGVRYTLSTACGISVVYIVSLFICAPASAGRRLDHRQGKETNRDKQSLR